MNHYWGLKLVYGPTSSSVSEVVQNMLVVRFACKNMKNIKVFNVVFFYSDNRKFTKMRLLKNPFVRSALYVLEVFITLCHVDIYRFLNVHSTIKHFVPVPVITTPTISLVRQSLSPCLNVSIFPSSSPWQRFLPR